MKGRTLAYGPRGSMRLGWRWGTRLGMVAWPCVGGCGRILELGEIQCDRESPRWVYREYEGSG